MHRKTEVTTVTNAKLSFYIETIEVNRLSALAFFAAGEADYKGKRFFWQNPEKTFTLVGLGHAIVLENHLDHNRFDHIEEQWIKLTQNIVKEEKEPQPVLFGSFTFDSKAEKKGEWKNIPESYFAVATFQLVIRNEKAYVSIHLITDDKNSSLEFERLRKERDRLIHAAQVKEVKLYEKPVLHSYVEKEKEQYLQSINEVTALIKNKQAEKVVIARSLLAYFQQAPTSPQVLSHVLYEQPESYLFGLERNELLFFGASPERLVKVENGKAYSSCVAGSIKRGKTIEEDEMLGQHLLNDRKNLNEHQYVVDMIKDVFEKNCDDYTMPKKPRLLKIRDIQHLYTPVEGNLSYGATILQLVKHLHPTPALGGAPKEKALSIIRQHETMNRGFYAAPIGWIDADLNGEFAVAIRSAAIFNDKAYLYAGGGIVENSDPQSEYEETLVKFRPMLRALGGQLHE